jgi:hypothetical protein
MTGKSAVLNVTLVLWLLLSPTVTNADESSPRSEIFKINTPAVLESQDKDSTRSFVKVLSDHPGSATALTPRQKTEIKEILSKAKGNQSFICTGASLDGQRESMYRVVLLRAQLVCDYAKAINPALKTIVQEKRTSAGKFNGRVVVVSK